jgi:hypothetical protein
MKNLLITIFSIGLFASAAMAKGTSNLSRGGYGFLFPDANSFNNGGQMAGTVGTAIEGYYTREDQSKDQTLTPSVVWGSGRVGLGAFVSRNGTSLTGDASAHSDSAGAGLGVSLASGRVTVGGTISKSLATGQTNDGVVNASLNYNGNKGQGFHMGGGFGTTLNSTTGTELRTATLAMGWGFSGANVELDYKLKDLDHTSNNYETSAYLNFGGSSYYVSTGYTYDKPSTNSSVSGRLGYLVGAVDFSVHAEHTFVTGSNPNYGASLRTTF